MSPGSAPVRISLPADRPPWTPTGVRVRAGDALTLLGSGFVRWSPRHELGAGPKFHLWGRVPGGRAFGCVQDTTTVTVDADGELELCVYVGEWADDRGTLTPGPDLYAGREGRLDVTVLHWPAGTDPITGLAALGPADADPAQVRAELDRLAHPVPPPPATWEHRPDFGPTEIFRAGMLAGKPAVDVVCADDMGILRTAVDVPVRADTTIEWTWRVDSLFGTGPETDIWNHDYFSVAAEFESGRDITWLWSASLRPVTDTFMCPARRWHDREYHMPLRSGTAELGRVLRERRNVHDDHRDHIGPPPGRIVAVWLIAVSHFAHLTGRASVADIVLATGGVRTQVL